ncbi:MAG: hypothetical protein Q9227_003401 [Pyrenula ochraceoflavens]
MCGRYALGIRAAFVRHQLQNQGLPVNDAPEDEQVRESYNFAPGYYGLVYRADVPDHGLRHDEQEHRNQDHEEAPPPPSSVVNEDAEIAQQHDDQHREDTTPSSSPNKNSPSKSTPGKIQYHLKAMKWGLIPFWTKRSPDYGSIMRTINCRDDSLAENRGMWTSMKKHKRCIVVCQGFYEWLKKGPGGKEKVPHFVKRKDGQLMCFAGLWDCVRYEDAEEKLYTYTIITTDSNKQLRFLHDRMPVVLDVGSEAMKRWLDPRISEWSKEMQGLLKPYQGELECYPVMKEVGKVGNNSADFIVPIDSKENKKNIANFFANAKTPNKPSKLEEKTGNTGFVNDHQTESKSNDEPTIKHEPSEHRQTTSLSGTEDNAPLPIPSNSSPSTTTQKRKQTPSPSSSSPVKAIKLESSTSSPSSKTASATSPIVKESTRKTRSATSNGTAPPKAASPVKRAGDGSQRITNFFGK